jgi:hypothetical protein
LLATIVLSLALVGLASKAFIPSILDDDIVGKVLDDAGNATPDDADSNGKPAPDIDSAKCKCPEFAKALLATLDILLPHALMPVHALLVCDAATEPLLPDHFLPNAETGPPVRLCSSPRSHLFLFHPPPPPPIIIAENGTTPCSFPRRSSL